MPAYLPHLAGWTYTSSRLVDTYLINFYLKGLPYLQLHPKWNGYNFLEGCPLKDPLTQPGLSEGPCGVTYGL